MLEREPQRYGTALLVDEFKHDDLAVTDRLTGRECAAINDHDRWMRLR
jgi:hypothetical protein